MLTQIASTAKILCIIFHFFAGTVSNGLSAFSKKMKVSSVLEKGSRFKVFGWVMKRLDRSAWIRNNGKNKGGCT